MLKLPLLTVGHRGYRGSLGIQETTGDTGDHRGTQGTTGIQGTTEDTIS